MFDSAEPLLFHLPCLVKARMDGDRRVVAVEASNETVDQEGDVITQKALLDGAPAFLKSGALDIDHISEIGARYGIQNPDSWIVGVPLEVRDLGGRRTEVVGELHKAKPGVVSKADELWEGLTRDPPVQWRASIYGWPIRNGGLLDARIEKSAEYPNATRYIVKGLDWRSLAFTRTPVNDAITGSAHVVTMKSFVDVLMKRGVISKSWDDVAMPVSPAMSNDVLLPRNRVELLAHHALHIAEGKCLSPTRAEFGNSVAGFREHFMYCCGMSYGEADILALALMQALKHRA